MLLALVKSVLRYALKDARFRFGLTHAVFATAIDEISVGFQSEKIYVTRNKLFLKVAHGRCRFAV